MFCYPTTIFTTVVMAVATLWLWQINSNQMAIIIKSALRSNAAFSVFTAPLNSLNFSYLCLAIYWFWQCPKVLLPLSGARLASETFWRHSGPCCNFIFPPFQQN